MMTLYEIDNETRIAIQTMLMSVDEETGEVDEQMAKAVEELQIARKEKLEAIGCYIKNLEAEQKAIKEEEKALKERADAKEKQIERLKAYVANSLLATNELKFESPRVAYSFRKSESVDVTDLSKIPTQYLKTKTTVDADKTAIKKAMKDGEIVEGAQLVIRQNLQIK